MKLTNFSPLVISAAVLFTACATTKTAAQKQAKNNAPAEETTNTADLDESTPQGPAEVNPDEIDDSIDSDLQTSANGKVATIGAEDDEISKAIKAGIPIEINKDVDRWIDFFANKNHDAFQRFLDRGQPYQNLVVATLRDAGVPSEMYYLAMIESGFVLQAKSSVAAVGFWQFMPATGRRYGLRVDKHVDERRDPWRSTVAASIYLSDLNNVFNSWYLAMAAYNAGEMRIMNAIMRGKSRDFWELVRQKVLPAETMDYIPKFLAAYMIGKNPEKYGFTISDAASHEAFIGVNVPSPIKLSAVAEQTSIPLEVIQKYNPHLKGGMTPSDTKTYKIWIPKRFETAFNDNAEKLEDHRMAVREVKLAEGKVRKFHRVRRGEHLNAIAAKYGLSLDELKEMNHLRSNVVHRGQKLRIVTDATESKVAKADDKASAGDDDKDDSTSIYRVRRGDRLHGIAKKFGMTVAELKKINKLHRNAVRVGQILKVKEEG